MNKLKSTHVDVTFWLALFVSVWSFALGVIAGLSLAGEL